MIYIPIGLLDYLAESFINSHGADHLKQYDIKKTYQTICVMIILKEFVDLSKLRDVEVETIFKRALKINIKSEEYLSLIDQAQNTEKEIQTVSTMDTLLTYEEKIEMLKLLFELKPVLNMPIDYDRLLIKAATILKCKKQDFISLKKIYK